MACTHTSLPTLIRPAVPAALVSSLACTAALSNAYSHRWYDERNQFLPDGLPAAAVHEFFLAEVGGVRYLPQAFIISGIARALTARKITVWIGRDNWPTPYALPDDLRAHAYFLNPQSEKQYLWALDAALRSPAVRAVITHHERLPFTLSQRFALTARSSGVIGIFTRPARLLGTPSAAPFRWQVSPVVHVPESRSWQVTLLKAKQSLPQNNTWIVNYEDETFSLRISPALVNRSSEEFIAAHDTKKFAAGGG